MPAHIVPNAELEKESLAHIKWVSGLNDTYKKNVNNFLNIEKDLGIIDGALSQDKLFAKL